MNILGVLINYYGVMKLTSVDDFVTCYQIVFIK